MTKLGHILFSYVFDKKGLCQKISNEEASSELEKKGLAWVHLDANHRSTKSWLEKEVNYLDHLIIDALITEESRPRITEFNNGILLILRGINLNDNAEPEDMVSIRIWIDDQRIITVQRRDMRAIFTLKNEIEAGKVVKSSAEFLYNLIYQISANTSPFLYALTEKLDILEENVLTTHDLKFREDIVEIRTQSAIFRRNLIPQKEVIHKLSNASSKLIDDWAKRHFSENLDLVSNMIEEIDEAASRSQILHVELANALSERMNRSMYKLSLITLIFLPLTFLTGLFGINLAGIPGSNSSAAFYVFSSIMLLIMVMQILFLKKKGWFKNL